MRNQEEDSNDMPPAAVSKQDHPGQRPRRRRRRGRRMVWYEDDDTDESVAVGGGGGGDGGGGDGGGGKDGQRHYDWADEENTAWHTGNNSYNNNNNNNNNNNSNNNIFGASHTKSFAPTETQDEEETDKEQKVSSSTTSTTTTTTTTATTTTSTTTTTTLTTPQTGCQVGSNDPEDEDENGNGQTSSLTFCQETAYMCTPTTTAAAATATTGQQDKDTTTTTTTAAAEDYASILYQLEYDYEIVYNPSSDLGDMIVPYIEQSALEHLASSLGLMPSTSPSSTTTPSSRSCQAIVQRTAKERESGGSGSGNGSGNRSLRRRHATATTTFHTPQRKTMSRHGASPPSPPPRRHNDVRILRFEGNWDGASTKEVAEERLVGLSLLPRDEMDPEITSCTTETTPTTSSITDAESSARVCIPMKGYMTVHATVQQQQANNNGDGDEGMMAPEDERMALQAMVLGEIHRAMDMDLLTAPQHIYKVNYVGTRAVVDSTASDQTFNNGQPKHDGTTKDRSSSSAISQTSTKNAKPGNILAGFSKTEQVALYTGAIAIVLLSIAVLLLFVIRRRRRRRLNRVFNSHQQQQGDVFQHSSPLGNEPYNEPWIEPWDQSMSFDEGSLAMHDSLALKPQEQSEPDRVGLTKDQSISGTTAITASSYNSVRQGSFVETSNSATMDLPPDLSMMTSFDLAMYELDAIAEVSSSCENNSVYHPNNYQFSYDTAPCLQSSRSNDMMATTMGEQIVSDATKEKRGENHTIDFTNTTRRNRNDKNSDNNSECRRVLQMS